MARKTFHHLKVDDDVVLKRMSWDPGDGERVEEQIHGKVSHKGTSRLKVKYPVSGGRFASESSFSMQGGQEWGTSAGIEWLRISPAHARPKGAKLA